MNLRARFALFLFTLLHASLWAVGSNYSGELGDGQFRFGADRNRSTPVQIATGAITASAGSDHSVFLQNTGTETPAAYAIWATTHGLTGTDATATADPDADGTPNLLEYAFGTSPAADSSTTRPTVTTALVGDLPALALTHRRLKSAVLITTHQSSTDRSAPFGWTPVAVTPVVTDPDTDGDGLVELVTVAVPLPSGVDSRLFLRVSVSE